MAAPLHREKRQFLSHPPASDALRRYNPPAKQEKPMQDILDLAQRLGKAIAESPQARKLLEARRELDKHKDLLDLLKAHREQAARLARLEEEQKPIEVDDKHKLAEIETRLAAADPMKSLTAAQMEYVDLMRKVNQTLQQHMGPPVES
jgi:cell fate (sporulation/competence/biofilm development) regulator YlbF (YheA/YmcA/DUF963 family)